MSEAGFYSRSERGRIGAKRANIKKLVREARGKVIKIFGPGNVIRIHIDYDRKPSILEFPTSYGAVVRIGDYVIGDFLSARVLDDGGLWQERWATEEDYRRRRLFEFVEPRSREEIFRLRVNGDLGVNRAPAVYGGMVLDELVDVIGLNAM